MSKQPRTVRQLFTTPRYMREWLESLGPRQLATPSVLDNNECPCARLAKYHGIDHTHLFELWHNDNIFDKFGWVICFVQALPRDRRVTAAKALKVLAEVKASS